MWGLPSVIWQPRAAQGISSPVGCGIRQPATSALQVCFLKATKRMNQLWNRGENDLMDERLASVSKGWADRLEREIAMLDQNLSACLADRTEESEHGTLGILAGLTAMLNDLHQVEVLAQGLSDKKNRRGKTILIDRSSHEPRETTVSRASAAAPNGQPEPPGGCLLALHVERVGQGFCLTRVSSLAFDERDESRMVPPS